MSTNLGSSSFVFSRDGSNAFLWGNNSHGQLGINNIISLNSPQKVTLPGTIIQICCGNIHTLILLKDGSLFSCGSNSRGQLGLGDFNSRTTFTKVPLNNIKQISCGYDHSMALTKDSQIYLWGSSANGECGIASPVNLVYLPSPSLLVLPFQKDNQILQICGGNGYTAVLLDDGSIYYWGRNFGTSAGKDIDTGSDFIKIETKSPVLQLCCGGGFAMCLLSDGSLLVEGSWGEKHNLEQILKIPGNIIQMSCGIDFALLLSDDGCVYSFGNAGSNQLGYALAGSYTLKPKKIEGLSNIVEVMCGNCHALAINADGVLFGWGYNGYGQLGSSNYRSIRKIICFKIPVKIQHNNMTALISNWPSTHLFFHLFVRVKLETICVILKNVYTLPTELLICICQQILFIFYH
eukprot:TRINITY_DN86_c0_g2_i1.p1 TRINITY_DN86_c0_g2~~TRINITY_DN86_c0_g2_i1.p1  ORF type:complete len:406 (-),score=90.89 TRINITY_DN86_c0_g2_i1:36-1253(-)